MKNRESDHQQMQVQQISGRWENPREAAAAQNLSQSCQEQGTLMAQMQLGSDGARRKEGAGGGLTISVSSDGAGSLPRLSLPHPRAERISLPGKTWETAVKRRRPPCAGASHSRKAASTQAVVAPFHPGPKGGDRPLSLLVLRSKPKRFLLHTHSLLATVLLGGRLRGKQDFLKNLSKRHPLTDILNCTAVLFLAIYPRREK